MYYKLKSCRNCNFLITRMMHIIVFESQLSTTIRLSTLTIIKFISFIILVIEVTTERRII